MNVEIPETLETIIRCNIHKVSIPDSDISMLVYTLTEWIKEQFLSHISILEEKIEKLKEGIKLIDRECSLCQPYKTIPDRVQRICKKLLDET